MLIFYNRLLAVFFILVLRIAILGNNIYYNNHVINVECGAEEHSVASNSKLKLGIKLISIFGYPGLFLGLLVEFVGIAFPGEIVLAFTGFLVWNGHMAFFPALLSSAAGAISGTVIAYLVGRQYGRPFLEKYGRYVFVRKKTINRAENWFNKHSILVLLLGRFVPGIRPLSAYMAGIAHMKFWVFAPLSLTGVLIWCITFVTLGTKLGQNWNIVSSLMARYNIILLSVAAAGVLIFVGIKVSKKIRLFTILFTALFWSLFAVPVLAEQTGKAVILIVDDLEIGDITKYNLVNFRKLCNSGAVGLMNTRTQTLSFDNRASAYLTIGMGARVRTTPQVNTMEIETLFNNLQKQYPNYMPGMIGDVANTTGIRVAVIGNADTDRPSGYSSLMAADRRGIIDTVNADSNILIKDKGFVWGHRTNAEKLIRESTRVMKENDMVFVDFGDTTRLAEARERLGLKGNRLAKMRETTLKNADGFLGELIPIVVREKAVLLVVSPTSSRDRVFSGIKNLSPVIMFREGLGKAVISSNTTRRIGLISNIDIAPTIFHELGVNTKKFKLLGEPVAFISVNDPLQVISDNYSEFVYLKSLRYLTHGIYVLLLLLTFYFLLIPLIRKQQYSTRTGTALAAMVISVPFISLVLPFFIKINLIYFPAMFMLLVVAAGLLLSKSVRRTINGIGALAAGTSLIMLCDLLTGRGYLLRTPLGFDDIFTGGRYYGLNNDSMGILLGSTVFALFFFLDKYNPNKIFRFVLTGIVFFVTVLVQTPVYGANVGGTLAAMITAIVAGVVLVSRRTIGIRMIPIILMLVFVIEFGISTIDASGAAQTHAGKTAAALLAGEAGHQLIEIIKSKLRVFLIMLVLPPWNLLFFAQAYFCIHIFRHNIEGLNKFKVLKPILFKSFQVIFCGAATAFIFNDTGIIATALMLTYATIPLGVLMVRKGCDLNEYAGEIAEKI